MATAEPPAPEREWLVELIRERLGERQFYALAAAVREHELNAAEGEVEPHDEALYARLRLICGEL
jgi:hypothetical protein